MRSGGSEKKIVLSMQTKEKPSSACWALTGSWFGHSSPSQG